MVDACRTSTEQRLWLSMVKYQIPRLKQYIQNLNNAFSACKRTIALKCRIKQHNSYGELDMLRSYVAKIDTRKHTDLNTFSEVVLKAHEIWDSNSNNDFFSSVRANLQLQILWTAIGNLGKLHAAFKVFILTAAQIPSFKKVVLTCISQTQRSWPPLSTPLDVQQTFDLLGLTHSAQSVNKHLGWNPKKTQSLQNVVHKFDELNRCWFQAHAEVQMVLYLFQTSQETSVYSYLGCSKYSCFMCKLFLDEFNLFKTKGTHGHLYPGWTVPETSGLDPKQIGEITSALMHVEKVIRDTLNEPAQSRPQRGRESPSGVSSFPKDMFPRPYTNNCADLQNTNLLDLANLSINVSLKPFLALLPFHSGLTANNDPAKL